MGATLSGCAATPYPANRAAVDTPGEERERGGVASAFSQRGRNSRERLIGRGWHNHRP